MISEDLEERFDAAADVVSAMFTEIIHEVGLDVFTAGRDSLPHLLISFIPGVRRHFTSQGGVYYEVEEDVAAFLGGAAQELPEAMEVVREICASNLFEGMDLPIEFRPVVFGLIKGTFPIAKRRGAPLSGNFTARWLLRSAAIYVQDAYGLSLTRYDGPVTMSACDVVCQVAEKHGVEVKYTALRDWCSQSRYAEFRNRADALSNYLKDVQLIEWRVLRRPMAFGPIHELARMRRST